MKMLIPILLCTFGIMLRGIETGHLYPVPKVPPLHVEQQDTSSTTMPASESCELGYTGTYPDCQLVMKKCRRPRIGTTPNCFVPSCPPTYSGTYPKCVRSSDLPIRPLGSTAEFPDCEVEFLVQKCPEAMCDVISTPSLEPASSTPSPTPCPTPTTQRPLTALNKIEWEDFKRMFNKTYANEIEDAKRQQIFLHSQDIVRAHNKLHEQGIETYSLAINALSDKSHDEFVGMDLSKSVGEQKQDYINT